MSVCFRNIALIAMSAGFCISCATSGPKANEKKSPQEMAVLYVDVGTQELSRAEYPQAIEDLRKALVYDPKNTIAHNHLALSYYGLGKKDLAKEELEKAVEIDPLYSDAWINLGNMALEESRFDLARTDYNRALENLEYKQRHRALTSLAQLALRQSNLEEARRMLYQSLQANPDYCLTHFLLGSIYNRDGTPAKAAEEFKKSVTSTCASNVEGHYQLGLAYMKSRDFEHARKQFALLIQQFPQTVQAQQAGDKLKDIP